MKLGLILMWLSAVLFLLGVSVFIVFKNNTVAEARTRIAQSWPVRFCAYRSGHGRHALA